MNSNAGVALAEVRHRNNNGTNSKWWRRRLALYSCLALITWFFAVFFFFFLLPLISTKVFHCDVRVHKSTMTLIRTVLCGCDTNRKIKPIKFGSSKRAESSKKPVWIQILEVWEKHSSVPKVATLIRMRSYLSRLYSFPDFLLTFLYVLGCTRYELPIWTHSFHTGSIHYYSAGNQVINDCVPSVNVQLHLFLNTRVSVH